MFLGVVLVGVLIYVNTGQVVRESDKFVKSLQTTYESYGIMGVYDQVTTRDDRFLVTPIGRMVIVKINKPVDKWKYKVLETRMKLHYILNKNVNEVFINKGGTVCVDCRN